MVGRALLLLVIGLVTVASAQAADEQPIGHGADAVYVLRPEAEICSVVLFGHGWTDYTPEIYMPWFDHLRARGSAIVYPQYQATGRDPFFEVAGAWQRGVRAGFEELALGGSVPVVVAGFSAGGPLAFQSALWAKSMGMPVPRAVHAIYPLGGVLTYDRRLKYPRATKVFIQIGALDEVVGRRGGDELWAKLARHPRKRKSFQVVKAKTGLAEHLAPLGNTPAVWKTFWAPLDRSVAEAQRARGGKCP